MGVGHGPGPGAGFNVIGLLHPTGQPPRESSYKGGATARGPTRRAPLRRRHWHKCKFLKPQLTARQGRLHAAPTCAPSPHTSRAMHCAAAWVRRCADGCAAHNRSQPTADFATPRRLRRLLPPGGAPWASNAPRQSPFGTAGTKGRKTRRLFRSRPRHPERQAAFSELCRNATQLSPSQQQQQQPWPA